MPSLLARDKVFPAWDAELLGKMQAESHLSSQITTIFRNSEAGVDAFPYGRGRAFFNRVVVPSPSTALGCSFPRVEVGRSFLNVDSESCLPHLVFADGAFLFQQSGSCLPLPAAWFVPSPFV